MSSKDSPKRKYKPHTFTGNLVWTGGRTWDLANEGGPVVKGSPPAEFGGEEGHWTPEDLLLASVNACQLSTFTSLAKRKEFEFVSYACEVEGILEHDGTSYKYSKIILRPKIEVKSEEDIEIAREYCEKAHQYCWMGYSVKAEVVVEPEITVIE